MKMNIKNFIKLKDNRYKINFDDKNSIILYDDIILKYNLLITKKTSQIELKKIMAENNKLECYYKALKYLSYKNRSKKELINYLKKNLYSEEDINEALKKLEEGNYLNENTYLKSYINDQINLTYNGPKKIKTKLIDLGLKEELINQAIKEVPEKVWYEKLTKIITKKIKSNSCDSIKKLQEKILYHCLNDGFKKEEILEILSQYEMSDNIVFLEKEAHKLSIKLARKYQDKELFYQLKIRLLRKGFNALDIDNIIDKIKKAS